MYEEILINGEIMDLDASFKGVQMVFQSPYLTDIQSIVSNRTNSVTFPATNHNRVIIGCASLQQDSVFPYRKHRAIYKRDGVQMFDGKATLLSVTDKQIQMCFTWGNTDAFQKLFDTNLRDLKNTPYCSYPPLGQGDDPFRSGLNYGGNRWGVCCNAQDILTAIENTCGVSGLTDLKFQWGDGADGYMFCLSLPTRNGDTTTRYLQRFKYTTDIEGKLVSDGGFRFLIVGAPSSSTHVQDLHYAYDASTKTIFTNGAKTARIKFKGSMKYVYYGKESDPWPNGDPSAFVGLRVYKCKTNGVDYYSAYDDLLAAEIDAQAIGTTSSYTRYLLSGDDTFDVDVEGYDYIAIGLLEYDNSYAYQNAAFLPATATLNEISVVFDANEGEEVMFNTGIERCYPVFKNLPDMSCGQFIKNLLWLTGKFGYSLDGKTIGFVSFNDLMTNKNKALDWTEKMITLQPKQRETKLDETARKNYFRYAEAEWYDNSEYQGILTCDDETIDEEKEYCKSDFALAPQQKINVWVKNDDEWDFQGDDIPCVMMLARVYNHLIYQPGFWNVQHFQNLLETYYQQYAAVIQHPVVIKAEFLITTADLNALDMRVPVYLKQTGRYYAIRKLTTKNTKVSEAELIELK